MLRYNISTVKMFPKGKGVIPLETNKIYQGLLRIKKDLEHARNGMEPYFQENRSFFRSVTSNFGSFKGVRFHISWRFNTPSVDNLWIIIYEMLSHFQLIPEKLDDEQKEWIHFSSENLPGSTMLSTYHYVHTMRNKDFGFKYNWFGSFPKNGEGYNSQDIYCLFRKYPNNFVNEPAQKDTSEIPSSQNFCSQYASDCIFQNLDDDSIESDVALEEEKTSIPVAEPPLAVDCNYVATRKKPPNDITDASYSHYVKQWLEDKISKSAKHKVDLFIGNITLEIDKDYNLEEKKHNKVFLGQIFLCFNILKTGGNAILRNLTFFTKFNISMIAWIRNYFNEFTICKPASSKEDSSEIFLICRGFKGICGDSMAKIEHILNDVNFDFEIDEIIRIDKIQTQFWRDIGTASEMFIKQIENINCNINNFNRLNRMYSFNQSKILRESQRLFHKEAEEDIMRWSSSYILKPLSQKQQLNIVNYTKKKYSRKKM